VIAEVSLGEIKPDHPTFLSVEGNRSSDAISALALLYPALLEAAALYLTRYDVDGLRPEELVHDAVVHWLSQRRRFISGGAMYVWLAKCMKGLAYDAAYRSTDVLDQRPLSLEDAPDGT